VYLKIYILCFFIGLVGLDGCRNKDYKILSDENMPNQRKVRHVEPRKFNLPIFDYRSKIELKVLVAESNFNKDYKILIVHADNTVDYKIQIVDPYLKFYTKFGFEEE